MRLSESFVPVPLIEAKDYGSAGIDAASPNLGLADGFSAFLAFGAITGNSILIVYAGASSGAKTTAIAFKYRLSAADYKVALADQLGDPIAVAATGLTLTATTFDHRLVAIEVDPDTMPDGKPYLTLSIDATATVLLLGAVGLARARYAGHLPNSIL